MADFHFFKLNYELWKAKILKLNYELWKARFKNLWKLENYLNWVKNISLYSESKAEVKSLIENLGNWLQKKNFEKKC